MRSRGARRLLAPTIGRVAGGVVLVLIACAACADSSSPAGTAPSTSPVHAAQAKVFVPVTAAVARTVPGTCWTGSITVGTPSAYRCLAGNEILDPCFAANRTARTVVCYADPWSRGVRIELSKPLPKAAPLLITHPWALELANGKRCVTATGVVARAGTMPLVYRCHGGGATGAPTSSSEKTRVRYIAPGSSRPVPVAVDVIWQA